MGNVILPLYLNLLTDFCWFKMNTLGWQVETAKSINFNILYLTL